MVFIVVNRFIFIQFLFPFSGGRGASKKYRFEQIKCPSHPNADLIEDYRAGDVVCGECGLVVGDR